VKRSKIGNEHAKRGLAYSSDGRAIAQVETVRGGLATFQPTVTSSTPDAASSSTRVPGGRSVAGGRSARQQARHKRLVETPRDRYISSFRRVHADGTTATSGPGQERPFAHVHPFYIPETLRPGGLRSALFVNDSKHRASAPVHSSDGGISLFEVAPREQAERAAQASARAKALFVDHFLSDPHNLLDASTGQIKDHSVARLAMQFSEVDRAERRRIEQQIKEARPTAVRQKSIARKVQSNVFLRLSQQQPLKTTPAKRAENSSIPI
jgi:hypothetical protein